MQTSLSGHVEMQNHVAPVQSIVVSTMTKSSPGGGMGQTSLSHAEPPASQPEKSNSGQDGDTTDISMGNSSHPWSNDRNGSMMENNENTALPSRPIVKYDYRFFRSP